MAGASRASLPVRGRVATTPSCPAGTKGPACAAARPCGLGGWPVEDRRRGRLVKAASSKAREAPPATAPAARRAASSDTTGEGPGCVEHEGLIRVRRPPRTRRRPGSRARRVEPRLLHLERRPTAHDGRGVKLRRTRHVGLVARRRGRASGGREDPWGAERGPADGGPGRERNRGEVMPVVRLFPIELQCRRRHDERGRESKRV